MKTETPTPAMNWMDFWCLNRDQALLKVHPDDRPKVEQVHSRLHGQTMAATCFNLLSAGLVKPC